MDDAPGVTGTTVTLFGDSDPLDHALSDQLGRRGCKTHYVSVPIGWLRSATHAIVRVDTAAGVDALKQLMRVRQPRSHVIAVCAETIDAAATDRVNEMCQACGVNHDISLIWHQPLAVRRARPVGGVTVGRGDRHPRPGHDRRRRDGGAPGRGRTGVRRPAFRPGVPRLPVRG